MPQYIIMGDSNLFHQDPEYQTWPWRFFYSQDCTASYIAQCLDCVYYPFPLLRMSLQWDNTMRLDSLLRSLTAHAETHLILWIGQNDTLASSGSPHAAAQTDTYRRNLISLTNKFIDKLLQIHAFSCIYLIGYHDHPSLTSNILYMTFNDVVIDTLQQGLPQVRMINMIDTTESMYIDGTHLTRHYQWQVAQHIAAQMQADLP